MRITCAALAFAVSRSAAPPIRVMLLDGEQVPADFPTAEKTSMRKEYDPPEGWASPGARPRLQAK